MLALHTPPCYILCGAFFVQSSAAIYFCLTRYDDRDNADWNNHTAHASTMQAPGPTRASCAAGPATRVSSGNVLS